MSEHGIGQDDLNSVTNREKRTRGSQSHGEAAKAGFGSMKIEDIGVKTKQVRTSKESVNIDSF